LKKNYYENLYYSRLEISIKNQHYSCYKFIFD
jgi:hypothetical protein